MVTGATHTLRAPIAAPVLMVTPTGSQSEADLMVPSGLTARGEVVVSKGHSRANEDAVVNHGGLVDQSVVLDLTVITHLTPSPM